MVFELIFLVGAHIDIYQHNPFIAPQLIYYFSLVEIISLCFCLGYNISIVFLYKKPHSCTQFEFPLGVIILLMIVANQHQYGIITGRLLHLKRQPRLLSGLRRSHVHSLMIARRSLCPEKLGSNPGQGSKGINFSGWHGLDMSSTVTKRR